MITKATMKRRRFNGCCWAAISEDVVRPGQSTMRPERLEKGCLAAPADYGTPGRLTTGRLQKSGLFYTER